MVDQIEVLSPEGDVQARYLGIDVINSKKRLIANLRHRIRMCQRIANADYRMITDLRKQVAELTTENERLRHATRPLIQL